MSSSASQTVPDEERDAVFSKLFLLPENKLCFDCKASNPKWASVNNGLLLCFQCCGKHRTLGVHVSFVRSCVYDKWSRKQLKIMELGGNHNAAAYFEKNGLHTEGAYNYSAPLAAKYRIELAKRAEAAVSTEAGTVSAIISSGEATAEDSGENESEVELPVVAEKKKSVAVRMPAGNGAVCGYLLEGDCVCRKMRGQDGVTLKAKKLDIDFDSIGTSDSPVDKEETKKPIKSVVIAQPKSKPHPRAEPVTLSDKIRKAKAISSTDYEFDLA